VGLEGRPQILTSDAEISDREPYLHQHAARGLHGTFGAHMDIPMALRFGSALNYEGAVFPHVGPDIDHHRR